MESHHFVQKYKKTKMSMRILKCENMKPHSYTGLEKFNGNGNIWCLKKEQPALNRFRTLSPNKRFHKIYNGLLNDVDKKNAKIVNSFEDLVDVCCESNRLGVDKEADKVIVYKKKYLIDDAHVRRDNVKKQVEIPILRCTSNKIEKDFVKTPVLETFSTFTETKKFEEYFLSESDRKSFINFGRPEFLNAKNIDTTNTRQIKSILNPTSFMDKLKRPYKSEKKVRINENSCGNRFLSDQAFAKELKLHPLVRENNYLSRF
jgi:hypothetical protein